MEPGSIISEQALKLATAIFNKQGDTPDVAHDVFAAVPVHYWQLLILCVDRMLDDAMMEEEPS